jgi:E3 ubiquitin-protein ligase HERC1
MYIYDLFFSSRYRGIDEKIEVIAWFWEVLESFSNDERIQFLRFVSGRTRLPANPADISQRFQIMMSDRVSYMLISCHS